MKLGLGMGVLLAVLVVTGIQAETRRYWLAQGTVAADFDGDGVVAFADFLVFLRGYGTRSGDQNYNPRLDLDGDGTISFGDFLIFGGEFGRKGTSPSQPKSSTGYTVYIIDGQDNSLSVFDYDSHLLIDYVPFRAPSGVHISRDQQSIYISELFGFFALNVQRRLEFSVPTDGRGRIALSPDGRYAFVTEDTGDLFRTVDLLLQSTIDTIQVGDQPIDIAVSPDGKKAYVLNQVDQDVSVISLEFRREIGRIVIGSRPIKIAITPDGRRAYVTSLDRGVLSVLDLATERVVGAIQLEQDGAFGLDFSPDGKTLYVCARGSLLEINVQLNLISRSLRIADNTSVITVSPDGTRAYVGMLDQLSGPAVAAIDLANWTVLGRIRGFFFPEEIRIQTSPSTPQ